ncbi:MAG: hypothetical protein PF689_13275 [Deltaproteobacteria bacterium]|jgi:hypothetical protein|nr:hypothetical protein [Deltaproteobacteria bacterium]
MSQKRSWFNVHPDLIKKWKKQLNDYRGSGGIQMDIDQYSVLLQDSKIPLRILDKGGISILKYFNELPVLPTDFTALLYIDEIDFACKMAQRIYSRKEKQLKDHKFLPHPVYLLANSSTFKPEQIEQYCQILLNLEDPGTLLDILTYVAILEFVFSKSWIAKRVLQNYCSGPRGASDLLDGAKYWKLIFNSDNQFQKYRKKAFESEDAPSKWNSLAVYMLKEERNLEVVEKYYSKFIKDREEDKIYNWTFFANYVWYVFNDSDLVVTYLNRVSTETGVDSLTHLAACWMRIGNNPSKARETMDKAILQATTPEDFIVCARTLLDVFDDAKQAQKYLDKIDFDDLDPFRKLRYTMVDKKLNGVIAEKEHPPQESYNQLKELLQPEPGTTDDFMTDIAASFLKNLDLPFDLDDED